MGTANVDRDHRTLIEATENRWWYSSQLSDGKCVVVFHTDGQDSSSKRARKQEGFLDTPQETAHISQTIEDVDYRGISDANCPRCIAAGSSYLEPFGDEGDQWCAVGDAAVAFDPLSSQGMTTALRMGDSLGIVLAEKLEYSDASERPGGRKYITLQNPR